MVEQLDVSGDEFAFRFQNYTNEISSNMFREMLIGGKIYIFNRTF